MVLERMEESELNDVIKFFEMSGELKRILRSGWVDVGVDSPESVADHTFRTAILCMTVSALENLDELRMIQMALLHDLPEVITGDLKPSEKTERPLEREDAAMEQLLSLLPEGLRERCSKLWCEYREGATKEAKAVKELEKLEMALQAREYSQMQPSLKSLKRFVDSADRAISSPGARKLFSCISDLNR
ncbi:HD domain-containing protein [Candidatus Bathyarchaeota archaeon]|nr:HD domain-containing protein [Candidatus Bathyarchaeota archaeon]NIU81162.1 HD domain-containing protein [Candidatus Bathyarchaeota archaeon]NIV67788.1 HD domain-containing protein [Candidatus Bathyarchaeota archaeon]NIW16282.1 HD domain-containing protein [Candidatus Bathyarchaeota archaeon]NIW34400.1 HD domain-containing protein [Candidatus Bathyarchaeota archaeon]